MEFDTPVPHKAASITSITSNSSWDNPPSLYSGRDSVSSLYDADESPCLQEPGSFEEFHFSLGLDPALSIPVPFEAEAYMPLPQDFGEDVLLDEHDKKTFGEFLNGFFIEEDLDNDPFSLAKTTKAFMDNACSQVTQMQRNPSPDKPAEDDSIRKRPHDRSSPSPSPSPSLSKRTKPNRDLLTEDEKRANHIASEQKRRNTIRSGFKDLTDIIPTLKNINNSKSTVLFKAVDYIRHLEKRNRGLKDRLAALQMRAEVKGRVSNLMNKHQNHNHHQHNNNSSNHNHHHHHHHHHNQQQQQQQHNHHQQQQSSHHFTRPTAFTTLPRRLSDAIPSNLPPEAVAALMVHKDQQRQLERLQEQLRVQQALLAKHNIHSPTSTSTSTSSLYNRLKQEQRSANKHRFPGHHHHHSSYDSISIPSHTNVHSPPYHDTPALVMPVTEDDTPEDWSQPYDTMDAPSLNIPADEEYGKETAFRERLLSCGKLKYLHPPQQQ
ncbi:helix-loop-helix DNA-binding domain-containing transcription factor [Phycomyces blakesleeanus]|uniref:Helix-loop-helix DNA-binding domain-containing transcription factor n=2 Tax=Phycomyces blakesleeanus TaxID=4837 RepID=A0A162WME6_PHYB8|nr:helix-loop-helix DNA-binding domain-containing transcription factor [Phycomyces blakesleeanus NRRL 1555(-)]OAD69045.1 helix-loop-helix DNA-binding domain-containing transcription factor [Phycomyces blakesleeanus NRRL 1555(-)]|eukprot:XP_018287085.1 helix-loop-helix DNA-binding domain-containing transcription factor [Phycomyces blakesleeanus NRRL 1555(-)]